MGDGATSAALLAVRLLSYSMLGYSLFYLAMYFGKWYEAEILTDFAMTLKEDLKLYSAYNEIIIFISLPMILSAALGGVYEAIWKHREANASKSARGKPAGALHTTSSFLTLLHNAMHYQFKPLGQYSPWLTVGEGFVLFLWVVAIGAQIWQGVVHYASYIYEISMLCPEDPSSWCTKDTGEISPTPAQYRLKMVAIFMGLVCSSHFAVILIPVCRDSKIWSALGVPFERAVLYHAIAGHLAFSALFTHSLMFIVYWVWFKGWAHAWHESTHVGSSVSVNTPMGWMALICATPMWITSINYVRRRWYSMFKLSHWLFIGVFVFGMMHWSFNAVYFIGGLTLYTMHVMSRLSSWKRWRYWNRWFSPETKASPTSLVSVATNGSYTRLVLRNPKSEPARGGAFVYISAPGVLGTDEAHAITVALRGAPPASTSSASDKLINGVSRLQQDERDTFTVYIKNLGPWTKALRLAARGPEAMGSPESFLVDVDGFYNHVDSFNSMMKAGVSRVVIIAGGSGMTSLMGFVQDWCVAAAEGATVPEVRLVWCCREMKEMKFVGESLPSMLASTGDTKDTHFTMSLFCSAKACSGEGTLNVSWPIDPKAYANSSTEDHVVGKNHIASSLNHSVRVILAAGGGYAGFLLGYCEVDRRDLNYTFHSGAILFVLVIVFTVSTLTVYGWLSSLVGKAWFDRRRSTSPTGRNRTNEESKMDIIYSCMGNSGVTYEVQRGRIPTSALLNQEADLAKNKQYKSVKVLTSGPNSLVNQVLADSRAIDWQLFDTEAFSFEF